jgi:hypothetical protein
MVAAVVSVLGWRAGFVVAGSIGFVWLALWLIVFGKPDTVAWLGATERARILAERDSDRSAVVGLPRSPLSRCCACARCGGCF